ncbi:MAG: hydroxylamine reductase, partial [Verrucomicrobia bacterium]|nr:hydroxylamine reductase [Verrucomicrobiota bacterium]
MSMFCYQCQETAKNEGCTMRGVCGKTEETANLQDLLVHLLKGISIWGKKSETVNKEAGRFIMEALFATITNANFDEDRFVALIEQAISIRDALKAEVGGEETHDSATWIGAGKEAFLEKAKSVGVLATENEDVRSLRELVIYGLKGIAAYTENAAILGAEDDALYAFAMEALAATTKDLSVDELVALVMKTGEFGVTAMAQLDG